MTTIALPTAPVVGALMGLGALGLALSRVYAGLHYPSDVLGGWIIGVGIGIIARQKELPRVPSDLTDAPSSQPSRSLP